MDVVTITQEIEVVQNLNVLYEKHIITKEEITIAIHKLPFFKSLFAEYQPTQKVI